MDDLFKKFSDMRRKLKQYKTKKDLLNAPTTFLREYLTFRIFLDEKDKRNAPRTVYKQFLKYKPSALAFKSEKLKIKLSHEHGFNSFDRYSTSQKKIAVITNKMILKGVKLASLKVENRLIDISYNNAKRLSVVAFSFSPDSESALEFIELLPSNYYVNIQGTSYNKNGLDFMHDYLNQSSDFANHLDAYVDNTEIFIYVR